MKPPTTLSVEIETASGRTYYLDAHSSNPGNRPLGLNFRTQRGDGFADASFRVSRSIARDWPDLNLLDTVRFIADDGRIDYEGRVASLPRGNSDGHSIEAQCIGWMSHTRQEPIREIIQDCDLSGWQGPGVQRKLNLVGAGFSPLDPTTVEDDTTGAPSLELAIEAPWAAPIAEAWYDSQGIELGEISGEWKRSSNISTGDANWVWTALLSTDDLGSFVNSTGDLQAAGPGSVTQSASGAAKFFAQVALSYGAASGGAGQRFSIYWPGLRVRGKHGLTAQGSGASAGYFSAEVMRYLVGKYASKLSPKGIIPTNYPNRQLAWKSPTDLYDVLLELNNAHNWLLSVFENRTLHFRPPNLLKADWIVNSDDPDVKIDLEGDSVDEIANGVIVVYTDVTDGKQKTLHPRDYAELRDTSDGNPYNRQGEAGYYTFELPFATVKADALQWGRIDLADHNQMKAPGTITVGSHIRRATSKAWRASSEIKEGQTIAVMDLPNSRPRMIHETSWNPGSTTLNVDGASKRAETYINRMRAALAAAGVST